MISRGGSYDRARADGCVDVAKREIESYMLWRYGHKKRDRHAMMQCGHKKRER
jgi:hypothetical protein